MNPAGYCNRLTSLGVCYIVKWRPHEKNDIRQLEEEPEEEEGGGGGGGGRGGGINPIGKGIRTSAGRTHPLLPLKIPANPINLIKSQWNEGMREKATRLTSGVKIKSNFNWQFITS